MRRAHEGCWLLLSRISGLSLREGATNKVAVS
jgi:hypothetical protein